MIVGEQRSGKTSLLIQTQNRLPDSYKSVFISFSAFPSISEVKAAEWLLDEILFELKKDGLFEQIDYERPPLKYVTDFRKELEKIVRSMKDVGNDYKLVLLLDEAQDISATSINFQKALRESFQHNEDVRVVIACYYDFFEESRSSGSPLHNIFDPLFLKPLDDSSLEELIKQPVRFFSIKYEDEAVETIKKISGGHVYYCQHLCANCFTHAKSEKTDTISLKHVRMAEAEILVSDKETFKSGYWDKLSDNELSVLEALIDGDRQKAKHSEKSVSSLVRKQLISNGQNFVSTLFRDWTAQFLRETSEV
jgi:hypothetical protein